MEIGKKYKLKEMPQLYGYSNETLFTVGKFYKVVSKDGSNVIIIADDNKEVSIGSCRFEK